MHLNLQQPFGQDYAKNVGVLVLGLGESGMASVVYIAVATVIAVPVRAALLIVGAVLSSSWCLTIQNRPSPSI